MTNSSCHAHRAFGLPSITLRRRTAPALAGGCAHHLTVFAHELHESLSTVLLALRALDEKTSSEVAPCETDGQTGQLRYAPGRSASGAFGWPDSPMLDA